MDFICVTLGRPGTSGFPVTSYFSDSTHSGAFTICLAWMSYAIVRMSLNVVLMVMTLTPLTVNNLPGVLGLLGLIVATSNVGFALAAIRAGGGGGSGIAHAVSGVALARFRGKDAGPWLKVPEIVLPSAPSFPSKAPPMAGIVNLTVAFCSVIG